MVQPFQELATLGGMTEQGRAGRPRTAARKLQRFLCRPDPQRRRPPVH